MNLFNSGAMNSAAHSPLFKVPDKRVVSMFSDKSDCSRSVRIMNGLFDEFNVVSFALVEKVTRTLEFGS